MLNGLCSETGVTCGGDGFVERYRNDSKATQKRLKCDSKATDLTCLTWKVL